MFIEKFKHTSGKKNKLTHKLVRLPKGHLTWRDIWTVSLCIIMPLMFFLYIHLDNVYHITNILTVNTASFSLLIAEHISFHVSQT